VALTRAVVHRPPELLNAELNRYKVPFRQTVASEGIGVEKTLKEIVRAVLANLTVKYNLDLQVVM